MSIMLVQCDNHVCANISFMFAQTCYSCVYKYGYHAFTNK